MLSILKKLTLATAAAGMLMLGPISITDNTAKADRDGWGRGRGWNNNYYRRGVPGDGWRGGRYSGGYRVYRPYYGGGYYRPYYGGYSQPYYGGYYNPGYSFQPWYNIYNVPGYYY